MDKGMTKADLVETLQARRAEWDALLAEVPEAWMAEPGVAGEWSVKDYVTHMTYYERWFADRLHEALRGESYTPVEMDRMHYDERNELIFQANRDRPTPEVLAESRQAFQRLLAGVQAQSEAFLTEPQQFEGVPQPLVVSKLIQGDVLDHYAQHFPAITSWLAGRRA